MSTILDTEAFVKYVEQATRKAGIRVSGHEGLRLLIKMGKESLSCDLRLAYDAYCQAPNRLDDVVQAHIAALRTVDPMAILPPVQERSAILLPILNPRSRLNTLEKANQSSLYQRPFMADLVINYVLDSPKHMTYVDETALLGLNSGPIPTVDQIHEVALANLRKRLSNKDYQFMGFGDRAFVVCTAQDGYAATRVLLPELLDTWARRLPGRMLIGLPNRDFMIAFGDQNPAHVAAVTSQVRKDAKRMHRPLTSEILVWQNGQLQPLRIKH